MKNIFNKTNAPYLAIGTLATLAFLASGVFAAAPYIGFLAPVAALSVGLPFVIGGAIFSAVVIALSAVAISKDNTISEKSTETSSLEKQLAKKEKAIEAKNKMIANPNKDDELKLQHRKEKQEEVLDSVALSNLFDENSKKKAKVSSSANEPAKDTKVSNLEEQLAEDAVEEQDTETPSSANEPANEENGQGWGAWSLDKAKTAAKLVVGGAIFTAVAAPTLVGTLFTGSITSPAGGMVNDINGTRPRY